MTTANSIDHLGHDSTHEYYVRAGNVYRAPMANPIDVFGYRQGARWEADIAHFSQYVALHQSRGLVVGDESQLDTSRPRVKI